VSQLLIASLAGNEPFAGAMARHLNANVVSLETREFPDGESYLRFCSDISGQDIALVCTLDRPNGKLIAGYLAAATAREIGACRVGLVAPYLGYMRQDKRFKPGEVISSRYVAGLLSSVFDWMVTVDPHLHRYPALGEIYTIPTRVSHAAPLISKWIKENIKNPVIIGPDSESQQWVAAVAVGSDAPYTVMEKIRRGDREVEVRFRDLDPMTDRSPILVDDIISSGRTMIEAVKTLRSLGFPTPTCLAVHGIFAGDAYSALLKAGASVATCNTVSHISNQIDVTSLISDAVRDILA
jgi:ribose-phosphate pyrophosphokinase